MTTLAWPLRLSAVSAFFWLPGLGEDCPKMESQYSSKPSPFGWPMSPVYPDSVGCWEKYPMCTGANQGPMNMPSHTSSEGCHDIEGEWGALGRRSSYISDHEAKEAWGEHRPKVEVSPYMRSVMVKGKFGSVMFKDTKGHDVEYEATQVHLASPSYHTFGWWTRWSAEMLIVHKPKWALDEADGSVIVSILFSEAEENGPHNAIFDKFGFGGHHAPHGSEWEVEPFGIKEDVQHAVEHYTMTYNGSLPVPPCSETVTWIVSPISDERVTIAAKEMLEEFLTAQLGPGQSRWPTPSRELGHGMCRDIHQNGIIVSHDHYTLTCHALEHSGKELPAECWDTIYGCSHAPAIIDWWNVKIGSELLGLEGMAHYTGIKHLEVQPAKYTLDAKVEHGGNFGYLMLKGRKFEATKMSVKPVGAHVVDGKRFAGELIIEHTLYGDLHHVEAGHGDHGHGHDGHGEGHEGHGETTEGHGEHSEGHGHGSGHGRRLEDNTVEGAHKLLLSIPLVLGKESTLLRHLGLPNPAIKLAMRDGNPWEGELDLSEELQPYMKGMWFWYSGNDLKPGCSEWGARWIVLHDPLEVSFEQLDFLATKISGFDSTPRGTRERQVFVNSVPDHGMVMAHSDCSGGWSYSNTACWKEIVPLCGTGTRQSPINIVAHSNMKEGTDSFLAKCSWKPLQGLEVKKTDLGLQVESNQLGYVAFVNETTGSQDYYQTTDVVLHMPSEHMIGGQQFDAELQVVHKRQETVHLFDDDSQLIASFLFKIGTKESPLLKQLLLPHGETKIQQPLDLMRALGPAIDAGYYRYSGSQTAPGCGEVVKWFVFDTPMEMSREQWIAFRAHFPTGNSRPVQPLTDDHKVTRNSFEEGVLVQQGFYLNRETTRDRSDWGRDKNIILIPILFSLFFSIYVMASLFVREDRDRKAQSNGGLAPAGLEQTIGRPYSRF